MVTCNVYLCIKYVFVQRLCHSLECSASSSSSRPPMTPVFSIITFFLYMFIFHVVALQSIIATVPRTLVPSVLPSKTVGLRTKGFLNTWPNQLFCLCRVLNVYARTMNITSRKVREVRPVVSPVTDRQTDRQKTVKQTTLLLRLYRLVFNQSTAGT